MPLFNQAFIVHCKSNFNRRSFYPDFYELSTQHFDFFSFVKNRATLWTFDKMEINN